MKRLAELEKWLSAQGWSGLSENRNPYLPWLARKRLVTEKISDESELNAHLATALRHLARHRGWRNPYVRVSSLYLPNKPSEFMIGDADGRRVAGFKQRVESRTGLQYNDDVTPAELAVSAIQFKNRIPLRMGKTEKSGTEREFKFIGGKLLQSDNANEIHAYSRTQGLSHALTKKMIDLVFAAESPRGSWRSKIGIDPLTGCPRALKASDAFQRFRMVSVLANVRLKTSDTLRRLSSDELNKAYEYLLQLEPGERPAWGDIAEVIGCTRQSMVGAATTTAMGEERMPLYPPVHVSDHAFRGLKLADIADHWKGSDGQTRDALIALLVDGFEDENTRAGVDALSLVNGLDEGQLGGLDKLDLPPGRSAYSLETLRKLTQHMLSTGDDLQLARKAIFGVGDDWVPPAEPIGAPVGNPSVDRVLKIIARFLSAAESEWGPPRRVIIEHVRDAFSSEAKAREVDRENDKRFKAKLEQRLTVREMVKADGRVRDSDVRRFEAIQRQNGQCLYCGDAITYETTEMDHIVPRSGAGSSNMKANLAAVCMPCNRSKSGIPFRRWADSSARSDISVDAAVGRTKFWQRDNGVPLKLWARYLREVRDRLERAEEDPEIDSRSMESVAWMANELRDRIAAHLKSYNTSSVHKQVFVYRGALTAEARKAAGVEGRIPWIGGGGKTRLDRRHHAVDAAVLTLLDESVARTLAERVSLREAERYRRDGVQTWKSHSGSTPAAQERLTRWRADMEQLTDYLVLAFEQDRVVVSQNLRLRLGDGRVHDDTIKPMVRRRVGEAFTRDEIDAASTPQLWVALTRDPEFDDNRGLPANPERRLRVRADWYDANDQIDLFGTRHAALAVRGGWARLGDSIHHARIYRWQEKGKTRYGMLRVFTTDLREHAHENLFSVEPHPSWISMRTAHPAIGRSDLSQKEYVGWLVPGDEILVRAGAPESVALGKISRWRVRGFEDESRLNLEPRYLAKEGLGRFLELSELDDEKAVREIVEGRGRRSVNDFFQSARPVIVRRDALGRPRLKSNSGLPVSWSVG